MLHTFLICLLIFLARISDVTLGTIRTMAIVNSQRTLAWCLGFFEVLIWIYAVSATLQGALESPLLAVAYALGFATGNYVGITVEKKLARGEQVVRIFTRCGPEVARQIRCLGVGVTQLQGEGRDGRIDVLFVKTRRRDTPRVTATARRSDEACFYTVDTIRYSSNVALAAARQSTFRSVLKMK